MGSNDANLGEQFGPYERYTNVNEKIDNFRTIPLQAILYFTKTN